MRLPRALVVLLLLSVPLAGCIGTGEDLDTNAALTDAPILVVGPDGEPVTFAPAALLDGAGGVVLPLSTDSHGHFHLHAVPASAETLVVRAPGLAPWQGALDAVGERIALAEQGQALDPKDPTPVLSFLEPLELGAAYLGGQEPTCEAYNCGASEPTVEVAGDGTIYASGVCCIGESPPIWHSTDGGETFQLLEGDPLRENFGIEGDFAIDDAGNLYFSDISAASSYFSSWDSEQDHRHTIPAYPFKPLVDRPWVRAGAEDVVYFAYNTGRTTEFYKSTDGGITWLPKQSFEGPLGTIGQGPERDHLWITVRGTLYESTDGGETWSGGEAVPTPSSEGDTFQAYWVPVVDEAGNVWVVYDWREGSGEGPYHIYAARRDAGGSWHGPFQVSPEEGTHHLPWAATGRQGTLAVAWYGTVDDDAGPNEVADDATWHVYTAVTTDGTAAEPPLQRVRADPLPVHEGPMNRKLLDFLQVDIGPDGAIHLVYAQDRDGQPDERTNYVRTTTGLQLQPAVYPNGPK